MDGVKNGIEAIPTGGEESRPGAVGGGDEEHAPNLADWDW
jgi:hypothetical protein